MMNRRSFMKAAALTAATAGLFENTSASDARGKPSILIILADDATYNDFPLYGGTNVKTPRIDEFARQGKTFSRAYLAMAMCQPCRTELYSGLYPMRSGTCWNHCSSLPQTKSMCHYLGDLGYRVGLAGKRMRSQRCFPFDKVEGFEDNCVATTADYNFDRIRRYAEADNSQPFCLVVGLVVPHVPWTVGDSGHFVLKRSASQPISWTRRRLGGTLQPIWRKLRCDKKVGDILDTLEQTGHANDTLVIFSTERGGQFPGCKWTNYESGSTAALVRWPGRVKPAARTDAMIQYADILPTLIEATGGQVAPTR